MRNLLLFTLTLAAMAPRSHAQTAPPPTAKAAATVDLTGYWVAYITEDWRFRMVTPRKGDFQSVPMTEAARKAANAWDPAADEAAGNQCKGYGAAAIMRAPGRFHITWQDDNTLKVESDWGTQTRLLHFKAQAPSANRSWQGDSTAQWQGPALKITTNNLRAGYLRRNGVPYSENATVTEYFDIAPLPNPSPNGGGQVLLVTSIVDDPQYLQTQFFNSSQFKKEADGSKWDPTPCSVK